MLVEDGKVNCHVRAMIKEAIKSACTCDIVEELKLRHGVTWTTVDNGARTEIGTTGPAIVLVIID